VLFLTSKLLAAAGVSHGFSLRTGGVSLSPFESLNLGFSVGDQPQAVEENLRRLREAANISGPITTTSQVHGDRVVDQDLREVLPSTEPQAAGADALVSETAAVGVRAADCVPILLCAGRKVAAVHSGWRGSRLKIVRRAVLAGGGDASLEALLAKLRTDVETAVRAGRLDYEGAGRLLRFYEDGLHGYTYLEG